MQCKIYDWFSPINGQYLFPSSDNEIPTFDDCPSSTSDKALAGTTKSISWTEPTADDNSGLAVNVTTTHDPGDEFGIGDTVVTYTAVDISGNSATCSFTVTIQGKLL